MLTTMRDITRELDPGEAATVFNDPVGYLAGFGIAAEVVAGTPWAEAA